MTHRIIRDPSGQSWDVWQVEPLVWNDITREVEGGVARADAHELALPSLIDPALANGWLCFESRGERRRLAPIPLGWERMTDSELEALCAWAAVVPRTYGNVTRPDGAQTPLHNDIVSPGDASDASSKSNEPPPHTA